MSYLVRCPKCRCLSDRAHTCPDGEEQDDAARVHIRELERRRLQHRRNYTRYMALLLALAALTLLLEVRYLTLDRYWFPVETILTMFSTSLWQLLVNFALDYLLVLLWLLLALGVSRCRSWWPIELACPRCNVRLAELDMKLSHCPGCQLWLG